MGSDFLAGNWTTPIIWYHAARSSVCGWCCCGCGDMGNALALAIMSTASAAIASMIPSLHTAMGVRLRSAIWCGPLLPEEFFGLLAAASSSSITSAAPWLDLSTSSRNCSRLGGNNATVAGTLRAHAEAAWMAKLNNRSFAAQSEEVAICWSRKGGRLLGQRAGRERTRSGGGIGFGIRAERQAGEVHERGLANRPSDCPLAVD